jgi:hypothetical protein
VTEIVIFPPVGPTSVVVSADGGTVVVVQPTMTPVIIPPAQNVIVLSSATGPQGLPAPGNRFIMGSYDDHPAPGAYVLAFAAPVGMRFPAGLPGAYVKSHSPATADTTFEMRVNGTQIGTATFAAGAMAASFSFPVDVTLSAGDIFEVVAPGFADLTLADLRLTFVVTLLP